MKKLFSYLLISSMVVLSSCTNYDDQFDDLNAQIKTLKSQIEGFSSLSSGLTALEGTVKQLQAAIIAIDIPAATDVSGLATAANLTALNTALTALATEVAAIKTTLATAATAAEVAALQTALTKAQADLTDLLAANNVFTGDVVINSASTLAAAESQAGKLGIVNGNVYITQSSTAIDATKLQTVVSKMVTVVGSVSYTHSGTGVTAVNFDKLTGAGTLFLNQEAPVDLPVLASVGAATVSATTKLTSINMPLLASVTSFNNGDAVNMLGGTKVTSIDLGSLARYDVALGTLTLTLSLTGDTTLDLASLTTTDSLTGLVEKLDLSVVGGDDLSLPLFVKGDISATNVKSLVLPKFIYTNDAEGTLAVTASKLETLAMHEVRGLLTLSDFSKLKSVDFIGTIDTSVTSRSVGGAVVLTGTNTSLTSAKFAGILAGATLSGTTNLTDVTTSGMIRAFTLDGSDDITTLTLGHKNVTGITGTNGENAGNASALTIKNNAALTSFSASELASLGTLIIKDNASLTAFTLKSTLSLGTALTEAGAAASEVVNVDISGNAIAGTVQQASGNNVSPAVTGKITQASLNGIATYLVAVEASILHGALTNTDGTDTTGYSRITGLYGVTAAAGTGNTGYSLTSANVIMNATSILDPTGTALAADPTYGVIEIEQVGSVGVGYKNNFPRAAIYFRDDNNMTVTAGGTSGTYNISSSDTGSSTTQITSDSRWAAYGVSMTPSSGANKFVQTTVGGTVSATTTVLSMTFRVGDVTHTVTATPTVDGVTSLADNFVTAFNAYSLTNSATVTMQADNVAGVIKIMTGTYSKADFVIDPASTSYVTAPSFTVSDTSTGAAANNNTGAAGAPVFDAGGYILIASSTSTATASTIAELGFAITNGTGDAEIIGGAAHTIIATAKIKNPSATYRQEGEFAAGTSTAAKIGMRAAWL